MNNQERHITSYNLLAIVLITLLALTATTVFVTSIDLAAWSVFVALLVASIKGLLVLTYFMHLKDESRVLKLLAGMVFLLFAIVIVITFLDYIFR